MKIGVIKEGKVPVDHRVALTPEHCKKLVDMGHEVLVEPSDIRCYSDQEYRDAGITLSNDLLDCEVLFGVKEVPLEKLIPKKTYFFFSHTIKKQPYNKTLLQSILKDKIRLVDYECLKNQDDKRIVAFGRWAGIVGAYNGIRTFGLKEKRFALKPAHECFDLSELHEQLKQANLPNIKICLTGAGRVSSGSIEILEALGVQRVGAEEFMDEEHEYPVYVQLDSLQYNKHLSGEDLGVQHFYDHPEEYQSTFRPYLSVMDLLIAGAYWDPKAPALFTKADAQSNDFNMKVIADITCDIEGSIPTTIRPSTIADPIYDFDLKAWNEAPMYENHDNLTVMAVDNLPCELPRDASKDFGDQLMPAITTFLNGDASPVVEGGSITNLDGQLTSKFNYLSDYVAD